MSYAFFCFVPQQHVTKMARSLKLHFMSGRRKFWVKNSFDSRIICTQRWSPRQLTNNYNEEKNTGKRNRTTLMVVVRGTIHTFVSSHFLSSCEKLRKKIEHYIDVMQIHTNVCWTLMVDRKIKQRGIKLFTQNTLNVLKLYE